MAAVRHLEFLILGNFSVVPVRRANMRNHAKFCTDWSNRCRDMAIFRFFKMAAAAVLDFKFC